MMLISKFRQQKMSLLLRNFKLVIKNDYVFNKIDRKGREIVL